ncbi:phage distal tail protein [Evansella clarkii]|uniref:phage distal tail protein n=1 Tax=Evansella clarkii TaxID=79879 RepID=UPI000B44C06F|nr:phage tail domain-containing protein [Evansella clarkii]
MKSELNFKVIHEDGRTFDMHECGLWVESFHIYSPNAKRTTSENLNSDGERVRKSKQGTRPVYTSYQIESDSLYDFDELKHLIFSIFYTNQAFEIIRDYRPDRRIFAMQEGEFDINNITPVDGEFDLMLRMYDPNIYGETNEMNLTTAFSSYEIKGQKKTQWSSRTVFSAAASQFVLENNTGGRILLKYNFIAGDVLEIDYKRRKITRNGEDLAVALSMSSNWFELQPGNVQLKASQATTLTYTERYY